MGLHNKNCFTASCFEQNFSKTPNDCWLWQGPFRTETFSGKYGTFSVDNKPLYAHRVAWQLYRGDIPEGACVLHSCDNPICVNPEHLYLGTHLSNARDRACKGRQGSSVPHNLSDEQVRSIRAKASSYTRVELGKLFNLSISAVDRIIHKRTYKGVT